MATVAAIALGDRIGADRGVADIGGVRIGDCAFAVQSAADLDRAAARVARRIDRGAVGHVHRAARHIDRAAGLTRTSPRGVDRSAHIDRSVRAGIEIDLAVMRGDGRCLDLAGVVDDVVLDVFHRAGRQQNTSAGRCNRARIRDQRGTRRLRAFRRRRHRRGDLVAQEIVAIEIDGELARAAQDDRAEIGLDDALVRDLRA